MSDKESPERDARVDEAYQMPWLTWGTEGEMHDDSNWSWVEGRRGIGVPPTAGAPPPGAVE